MDKEQQEKYDRAKKHVVEIKVFYTHLVAYIIIIPSLFVVNLLTSPNYLWFKWSALGWGVGILIHAFTVFFFKGIFGKEWEERKIKELMEKDR